MFTARKNIISAGDCPVNMIQPSKQPPGENPFLAYALKKTAVWYLDTRTAVSKILTFTGREEADHACFFSLYRLIRSVRSPGSRGFLLHPILSSQLSLYQSFPQKPLVHLVMPLAKQLFLKKHRM